MQPNQLNERESGLCAGWHAPTYWQCCVCKNRWKLMRRMLHRRLTSKDWVEFTTVPPRTCTLDGCWCHRSTVAVKSQAHCIPRETDGKPEITRAKIIRTTFWCEHDTLAICERRLLAALCVHVRNAHGFGVHIEILCAIHSNYPFLMA